MKGKKTEKVKQEKNEIRVGGLSDCQQVFEYRVYYVIWRDQGKFNFSIKSALKRFYFISDINGKMRTLVIKVDVFLMYFFLLRTRSLITVTFRFYKEL